MLKRRRFLNVIGGSTIVAASTASAFWASRTPTKALAPWDSAGQYEDPREWALSYALLAPNPHNRQPWLVDLREANHVTIYRDKHLGLPQTDPFSRQLTIGMGCFIELMKIAAAEIGFAVECELFPNGDDGPVAKAQFYKGAIPDPLFRQILNRRSCKKPFSDEKIPLAAITALAPYANIYIEPNMVNSLKILTWEAWKTEAFTVKAWQESVELMRIGIDEINAHPDGIYLGGPMMEILNMAGVVTREAQRNTQSPSFKKSVEIYKKMLAATPAYAAIHTPTNTREDQIFAGSQWLKLNLTSTQLGLALHPVSQALQEYPEMSAHYQTAHNLLAPAGSTLQMLGRLGYGPESPKTPRWLLQEKLLS